MFLSNKFLYTSLLLSSAVVAAASGGGGTNPVGSGGAGAAGGAMSGPGPSSTTSSASTSGASSSTGSGGPGCQSAANCNDGFSCTIDVCTAGICSHTVGPNTGVTACGAGSFCEVNTGCVPGVVCATTDQCVQKLGDDVCKTHIVCDAATSICTYQLLDKDGDGQPPVVCAGDDCDDSDAARFKGNLESCNNKDDDCDGVIDDGATCPGVGVCESGACSCAPEDTCGSDCVDKASDPNNCGACGNQCSGGTTCVGSQCKCAMNGTMCNGQCVDTKTDPANCNGCGKACAPGYLCDNGACSCLGMSCGGVCIDQSTDPNHCGNCATQCTPGAICQGGACKCSGGLTLCNGACVDTNTDVANCGTCNHACVACLAGSCVECVQADLVIVQDLSGSMQDVFDTAPSRWKAVQGALGTFLTAPQSSGMGVGISYYPFIQPTATCVANADCGGAAGKCTNGICVAGTKVGDSCAVADYTTPSVPIGLLPGNAAALNTSINSRTALGGTPQATALQGALTYAKAWAIAHPSHKVGVVLIADGLPSECSPNKSEPTDTAKIASTYALGTPSVKTYVIGLGPDVTQAQWNQISTSGGTGTANLALTTAALAASLNTVRTAFDTCP